MRMLPTLSLGALVLSGGMKSRLLSLTLFSLNLRVCVLRVVHEPSGETEEPGMLLGS